MISVPKHLQSILQRAAQTAIPGLSDPVAITAERKENWDYVSPSAIKFFNMQKKSGNKTHETCHEMAQAIVDNLKGCPEAKRVI